MAARRIIALPVVGQEAQVYFLMFSSNFSAIANLIDNSSSVIPGKSRIIFARMTSSIFMIDILCLVIEINIEMNA